MFSKIKIPTTPSKTIFTLLVLFACSFFTYSQNVSEGENIFKQKCTACHKIGGGKLVGPDLKGVTARREEAWLKKQIKTPDVMIAEKDPIVLELLKESNNVPMAPLGLSDAEVQAVIDFLKSTEQQMASVSTGLPSQYLPTILISIGVALVLTLLALGFGRKKVEVR